jgi:hypothetical protein
MVRAGWNVGCIVCDARMPALQTSNNVSSDGALGVRLPLGPWDSLVVGKPRAHSLRMSGGELPSAFAAILGRMQYQFGVPFRMGEKCCWTSKSASISG